MSRTSRRRPTADRPVLRVEALESRDNPATFNVAANDVAGLVAAIAAANTNNQPDTINLAASTYSLTAVNNTNFDGSNGLPVILPDGGNGLTINGNGATISRPVSAPDFRILAVSNGVAPLTVSGVTITGGKDPGLNGGAGIFVNDDANLSLVGSTVFGNRLTTVAEGGGICTGQRAVLRIADSTISGNFSLGPGGGIGTNTGSVVVIENSTISGNTAFLRGGGASFDETLVTVSQSTISNNISRDDGGGLFLFSTSGLIQNSTISDNAAGGNGGGVCSIVGVALFLNSTTVAGNSAGQSGGGVFVQADRYDEITSTILAGNRDGTGANDLVGSTVWGSGNLFQQAPSTLFEFGSNIKGVDPMLGPLQNNGGRTQTRALLPGSPARDASPGSSLATDQRGPGFARVVGARQDIGAFELQPPAVTALAPTFGPAAGGTAVTITGTGLAGTTAVWFGTTPAASFVVDSPTSVTAVAPAGTGAVDVTVVTFDGTSATGPAARFTFVAPAVVPPPPPPVVLAGAGTVTVFNPATGQQAGVTPPFGGIPANVAVGDLTGDGVPDFAFVPGAGGGPVLNVVDGKTGATVVTLFALPAADFRGGLSVAVGAGAGGRAVVAVGAGATGGPVVRVFDAATLGVAAEFFAFDPALRTGVNVAFGDVNRDGVDDLIVTTAGGVEGQVKVIDGTKLGQLGAGGLIRDDALVGGVGFLPLAGFTGGLFVAAGNLDRDGFADVVVTAGATGGPVYVTYSGADLAAGRVSPTTRAGLPDGAFRGGLGVTVGDVNGDGRDDVLTTPGAGGGPALFAFDGVTGDLLLGTFVGNPNDRTGRTVG